MSSGATTTVRRRPRSRRETGRTTRADTWSQRAALAAALAFATPTCAAPNAVAPRQSSGPRAQQPPAESPPLVLDPEETAFLALPQSERFEAVRRAERVLSREGADAATVASAELELERALHDDFELRGVSLSGCGLVRIRDLAARALGRRAGVDFRCFWPMYDRDRAAARISNALRARRGLPARPVPARPSVPPADADAVRQARAALLAATDATQAREALATYAQMGLAGLAPLRAAFRSLPARHPARRSVPPVLARLASTIRAVVVEDEHAPLSASARFSPGETLTPEGLVEHLRAAYEARPSGAVGVRINRDSNGLGVNIVMRSLPVTGESVQGPPTGAPGGRARYEEAYFEPLSPDAGFQVSCAGGAPGSADQTFEPAHMLRTLAWLVKAPPEVAGELRITMSWPTTQPPLTPEREAELWTLGRSPHFAAPPTPSIGEFERACGAPPPVSRFPDDTTLPEIGACPATPMTWTIPASEMDRNYGRTVGPGLCFGVVHFGRTGRAVEGCDTFHCSTLRYCDGTERAHHCSILAECRNGVPVATGFSW